MTPASPEERLSATWDFLIVGGDRHHLVTFFFFNFFKLLIQQGSHAVGLFAQSTTNKHYFHTDELQMGLVGQKENWMRRRS